jgi:hypothetical protein
VLEWSPPQSNAARGLCLPLTFQVGDAHHLDFPDQGLIERVRRWYTST